MAEKGHGATSGARGRLCATTGPRLDHGPPFWRGRLDRQDLGSWRRVRSLDGGGLGKVGLRHIARLGRLPHGTRRLKLDGADLEERPRIRRWPALGLEIQDLLVQYVDPADEHDDE